MHIRFKPSPKSSSSSFAPGSALSSQSSSDTLVAPEAGPPAAVATKPTPMAPGRSVSSSAAPINAAVRILAVFNPTQLGCALVLDELSVRYGLDLSSAQNSLADIQLALLPLHLDAAVARLVKSEGDDAELQGVADFFEEQGHEALSEKLADLAPILRSLLQMPSGAAAQDSKKKAKPSESCTTVLKLLLPEYPQLPNDAPIERMAHAVGEMLNRSERKAAIAWMSNPNYPKALRLEAAVDATVGELCLREPVLDRVLKRIAPAQLSACDAMLAQNSDDIAARRLRAKVRSLCGDTQGALADYDALRAVELDAGDYFARASLQQQQGNGQAAEADFENAVFLDLSNSDYYAAFLRASAANITEYIGNGRATDPNLLSQRGARLLALGDASAARHDYKAAAAIAKDHPAARALGAALARYKHLNIPEAARVDLPKGVAVDEKQVPRVAAQLAAKLPWADATCARMTAIVQQDFGFVDAEAQSKDMQVAFKSVRQEASKAVGSFLAQACTPEQLGDFQTLLAGPFGPLVLNTILPWADKLQLRQDTWADSLRTDVPLAVAAASPLPITALREAVQTLLPSADLTLGGLHGAVGDTMAADFARGIAAADLPTVMGLLRTDTVKMLVLAHKASLLHVHANASGAAIVQVARAMAPREVARASSLLAKDPLNADALRTRAIAHGLLEAFPAALADFEALIAVEPVAKNYVQRAVQFSMLGQQDRALNDANEALRLAPLCADAHTVRASVYLARNERKEATADAQRALALSLTNAQQQSASALYALATQQPKPQVAA